MGTRKTSLTLYRLTDNASRSVVRDHVRSGKSDDAVRSLATEGVANPSDPFMQRPPHELPDPWHYDSEALLADLDHVRQLVLMIPHRNDNFGQINTVLSAVWELQQRLRYLLQWQQKTVLPPPC